MAYRLKYRLRYETSFYKKDVKIDISPKDFSGTAVYKKIGGGNITLSKEKSGKIRATSLTFPIQVDVDFEYDDFFSGDNKNHRIELLIDDVIIWSGFMVSDQYSESYIAPPYDVSVLVTDGLGLLKTSNFELTGIVSRLEAIRYCLDKIGLNIGYAINIDLFETRMTTNRSMLEQLYFNADALRDKNCYDALECLIPDGGIITQTDNRWLIQRENEPEKQRFLYDYQGNYESVQDGETIQFLGKLNDVNTKIYPISGNLTRDFSAAWKNFVIKNNYGKKDSFFKNHDFSYEDATGWTISGVPSFAIKSSDSKYYGYIIGKAGSKHSNFVYQSLKVSASDYKFIFSLKYDILGSRSYETISGLVSIPVTAYFQLKLTGTSKTYYLDKDLGWTENESYISQDIDSSVSGIDWKELKIIASNIPIAGILQFNIYQGYVATGPGRTTTKLSGVAFTEVRVYTKELEDFNDTQKVDVYFSDDQSESDETIEVLPTDLPDYNNAGSYFLNGNYIDVYGEKVPSLNWSNSGADPLTYNNFLAAYMAELFGQRRQLLKGIVRGENMHLNALMQHNYNDSRQFYVETGDWNILDDQWNVTFVEILGTAIEHQVSDELDPLWGLVLDSIIKNAEAVFYRIYNNEFVNKFGSNAILLDGYVIFPELETDLFDRSDLTYWNTSIGIYDSNYRKWPIDELTADFIEENGTEALKSRLFFNEYIDRAGNLLPILIFSGAQTTEEISDIKAYLSSVTNISGDYIEVSEGAIQDAINSTIIGAVNLLRNTAFTGDYESLDLENKILSDDSELFSEIFKYWSGSASQIADYESASGYAAVVMDSFYQVLTEALITGEKYVLSFKAKGDTITVTAGSFSKALQLNDSYDRHIVKFTAGIVTSIVFEGAFTICEPQLERGTIVSAWSPSLADNNSSLQDLQSIEYISDAIKGKTEILGGLILSSMLQLGIYNDGILEKITAGISGIYNDDNDPAVWGGGTIEDAIKAIMDPASTEGAKFVLTHGGKAILNEAFVRGKISSKEGDIGGFDIGESTFVAERKETIYDDFDDPYVTVTNKMLLSSDMVQFISDNTMVQMGSNIVPFTSGGFYQYPFYVSVSREPDVSYPTIGNMGFNIRIEGAHSYDDIPETGNHALFISKGDICGFRIRSRRISTSQILSNMDSILLLVNTVPVTITLPLIPEESQIFFLKSITSSNFTIEVGNSAIQRIIKGASDDATSYDVNDDHMIILIWDKVNNIWTFDKMN